MDAEQHHTARAMIKRLAAKGLVIVHRSENYPKKVNRKHRADLEAMLKARREEVDYQPARELRKPGIPYRIADKSRPVRIRCFDHLEMRNPLDPIYLCLPQFGIHAGLGPFVGLLVTKGSEYERITAGQMLICTLGNPKAGQLGVLKSTGDIEVQRVVNPKDFIAGVLISISNIKP